MPEVSISEIQHGTLPLASRLNPRFAPDTPLLLATLKIRWAPRNPQRAIADLEKRLLAFSPGFRHHECRGMGMYHVFSHAGGNGKSHAGGEERAASSGKLEGFDAALALAHLLEHAVIDFLSEVTGEMTCSGITGAHRSVSHRYDLLVECRELEIGCCCLALALGWIQGLFRGHPMGSAEKDVLSLLRWMHRRASPPVFASRVAGVLGWSEDRAERALAALQQTGYLESTAYAMNLSGLPAYRPRRLSQGA
ncbi:MAG: hypothetical protein L0Z52_04950 [Acidobacteria bacterium]|nr:hypothetical protein [Acidobacteriota bacterium]